MSLFEHFSVDQTVHPPKMNTMSVTIRSPERQREFDSPQFAVRALMPTLPIACVSSPRDPAVSIGYHVQQDTVISEAPPHLSATSCCLNVEKIAITVHQKLLSARVLRPAGRPLQKLIESTMKYDTQGLDLTPSGHERILCISRSDRKKCPRCVQALIAQDTQSLHQADKGHSAVCQDEPSSDPRHGGVISGGKLCLPLGEKKHAKKRLSLFSCHVRFRERTCGATLPPKVVFLVKRIHKD